MLPFGFARQYIPNMDEGLQVVPIRMVWHHGMQIRKIQRILNKRKKV